jgi:hypothetical protein
MDDEYVEMTGQTKEENDIQINTERLKELL